MGDRRVAPVEHAQPSTVCVDVRHVQVVVLDRFRHLVCGQLVAELGETRHEATKAPHLVALERQSLPKKTLVALGQGREP